ncbi:hypothetical protein E4U55_006069 [Claviceps digitariae]|nr:hypothetical protein E4U55_006069 [Claviceps digitariae]
MHSVRAFQKLLIASAILFAAQASWLDKSKLEDKAVIGRQVAEIIGGVGGTGSAAPNAPPAANIPTHTNPSTSSVPHTTPPPQEVVLPPTSGNTPAVVGPSSAPPSIPIAVSSGEPGSENDAPFVPKTTGFPSHGLPTTPAGSSYVTATPVVSTKIEVITSTLSNGSKAVMTTITKVTTTPGLSHDEGETTGMTSKTRNTVIGVVVGIGGAIVLGALGLVAWRIWGRKKHSEEHDVLMEYDMSSPDAAEKSERGSSAGGAQRTPFQSTLENYHQPNQVNPSSNF